MTDIIVSKINQIINSGLEVPIILKQILMGKTCLTDNEEIIDLVFLNREYIRELTQDKVDLPSALLIATSSGVILVEEGSHEADLQYGGYRIRSTLYSKIRCLEFDTCLLVGVFIIKLGSNPNQDIVIEFNTSKNFYDFESITNTIRGMMIKFDKRL